MQRCTRVDVFIYKINFLGGSRCGAAFSPFAGLGCLQRTKRAGAIRSAYKRYLT